MRPVQLAEHVGQRTQRPRQETTTSNRDERTAMAARILQRPPTLNPHPEHHAGHDQGG